MTFARKHIYREMYLNFIREPKDSERRLETDSGIYQDYIMTTEDGVKVHLILLDVRFDFNETKP